MSPTPDDLIHALGLEHLESIAAYGTQAAFSPVDTYALRRALKPSNRITCADGFTLSVIAGWGAHCHPRPDITPREPGDVFEPIDGMFDVTNDYPGPFDHLEVGYTSKRPEPWGEWSQYCEDGDNPTQTVYAYVPVDLIRALILLHGGEFQHNNT